MLLIFGATVSHSEVVNYGFVLISLVMLYSLLLSFKDMTISKVISTLFHIVQELNHQFLFVSAV